MNREADICRFKTTYRYLKNTYSRTDESISEEMGLALMTAKKLLDATKGNIPDIRNGTWAKVQDFNEKYRDEVGDLDSVSEMAEYSGHMEREYAYKGNGSPIEKEELENGDEWDMIRALVKMFGLKVSISMNIKIEEPYVSPK